MTWPAAFSIGFGTGLVSFAGLWLTVRRPALRSQRIVWTNIAGLFRVPAAGLALSLASLGGVDRAAAALVGFGLARECFLRGLGGVRHG